METTYNECEISGTLCAILFISSIAGIAPVKIEKTPEGWKVKTSAIAHLYGRCLVLILCILWKLSMFYTILMDSLAVFTLLEQFVTICVMILLATVGLMWSFSGMKRMRHLIQYQMLIAKINNELNGFFTQVKYKEWKTFVPVMCFWLFVNFILVHDFLLNLYAVFFGERQFEWKFMDFINHTLIAIVQLTYFQYCLVCMSVLFSYKQLNVCLKGLLIMIQDECVAEYVPQSTTDTLNRISHLYCTLNDIVGTVTDTYGIFLVPMILLPLLFIVVSLYQLIFPLVHAGVGELYSDFTNFWWVVTECCNLLLIIEPCHRAHEEMAVSKSLTSKLLQRTHCSQRAFFNELQLFYSELTENDVTFSPLGMFTLNRSLILTIVGLIMTYLVIMISS